MTEDNMTDETAATPDAAAPASAPTADDQGNTDAVVPTDAPAAEVAYDDLAGRVEALEATLAERDAELLTAAARVTELETQVADLEADPFRAPPVLGATQFDIPSVAAHEEQLYQAEVEGWERTYGDSPVQPDAEGIEV